MISLILSIIAAILDLIAVILHAKRKRTDMVIIMSLLFILMIFLTIKNILKLTHS